MIQNGHSNNVELIVDISLFINPSPRKWIIVCCKRRRYENLQK